MRSAFASAVLLVCCCASLLAAPVAAQNYLYRPLTTEQTVLPHNSVRTLTFTLSNNAASALSFGLSCTSSSSGSVARSFGSQTVAQGSNTLTFPNYITPAVGGTLGNVVTDTCVLTPAATYEYRILSAANTYVASTPANTFVLTIVQRGVSGVSRMDFGATTLSPATTSDFSSAVGPNTCVTADGLFAFTHGGASFTTTTQPIYKTDLTTGVTSQFYPAGAGTSLYRVGDVQGLACGNGALWVITLPSPGTITGGNQPQLVRLVLAADYSSVTSMKNYGAGTGGLVNQGNSPPSGITVDRVTGRIFYVSNSSGSTYLIKSILPPANTDTTSTLTNTDGPTVPSDNTGYSMTVRNKLAYVVGRSSNTFIRIADATTTTAYQTVTTSAGAITQASYSVVMNPVLSATTVYVSHADASLVAYTYSGSGTLHTATTLYNPTVLTVGATVYRATTSLAVTETSQTITGGSVAPLLYLRNKQITTTVPAGQPWGVSQNLYSLALAAPAVTAVLKKVDNTLYAKNGATDFIGVPDYTDIKLELSPEAAPLHGGFTGNVQCSSQVVFANSNNAFTFVAGSTAPQTLTFQIQTDDPVTVSCALLLQGRDAPRFVQSPIPINIVVPTPVRAPIVISTSGGVVAQNAITGLTITPAQIINATDSSVITPPAPITLGITCACNQCYASEGNNFLTFVDTGLPTNSYTFTTATPTTLLFTTPQPAGSIVTCSFTLDSKKYYSVPASFDLTVVAETVGNFRLTRPEFAPFPNQDATYQLTPRVPHAELPGAFAALGGTSISASCQYGVTNIPASRPLTWSTNVPLTKSFIYRAPASPTRGLDFCTFTVAPADKQGSWRSFRAYIRWGSQLSLTPVLIRAEMEVGDAAFYSATVVQSTFVELAFQPEAVVSTGGLTVNVRCDRGLFKDGQEAVSTSLFIEPGTTGLSTFRLVYFAPATAGLDTCRFQLTGVDAPRFRTPKPLVFYIQENSGSPIAPATDLLPGTFSPAQFPTQIPLGALSEPIEIRPLPSTIVNFDANVLAPAGGVWLTVRCRYGRTSNADQSQFYLSPAELYWDATSQAKRFFRYEAPRVAPPAGEDHCWFELSGPGATTRYLPVHESTVNIEGTDTVVPGFITLLPIASRQARWENDLKIQSRV